MPQTIFDRIWDSHRITALDAEHDLLLLDRIFLHERTGGIALLGLEQAGRTVRCPQQVFCTFDHIVSTQPGRGDDTEVPGGHEFIRRTRQLAQQAGIRIFDIGDPQQGIVHVVAAEQGIALPGCTLVCADSHTGTLGGMGTLAWGVGSSALEHALATQTLRLSRPQNMRVEFHGQTAADVTAKDMALHLIGQFGAGGGAGCAVEFCGEAVRALTVEGRFTLCNMATEFSAFCGIIAPDDSTIAWLQGRHYAPQGALWKQARTCWSELHSDPNAHYEHSLRLDAAAIRPTVTWGTSPEHAVAIDGAVPNPAQQADSTRRGGMQKALDYMGLSPGQRLTDLSLDGAFIGSCTNNRLDDLRAAATVLRGRRVAPNMRAICVPGSTQTKRAAEREGVDRVFTEAGFEWREAGCSLCFYAGGECFEPGQRVISSTNRNFEGRQGPGVRTHLASPVTVAASAVAGSIISAGEL